MSDARRIVDAAGRAWLVISGGAPSKPGGGYPLEFREEAGAKAYATVGTQPLAELGDEMLLVLLEREYAREHPTE